MVFAVLCWLLAGWLQVLALLLQLVLLLLLLSLVLLWLLRAHCPRRGGSRGRRWGCVGSKRGGFGITAMPFHPLSPHRRKWFVRHCTRPWHRLQMRQNILGSASTRAAASWRVVRL